MRGAKRVIAIVGAACGVLAANAHALGGAAPHYLPDLGCTPVENASDDTAHAYHAPSLPQVKLVYARTSDASSDFATKYPAMSSGVLDAMELVYHESGGLKSVRFDLGTSAGPDCVDVANVVLPNPSLFYGTHPTHAREKIVPEVRGLLGAMAGPRNLWIFVEGVTSEANAGNTEPGPFNDDSFAGTEWAKGGIDAVIYDQNYSSLQRAFGYTVAHELFHSFGAVRPSAPRYAGGGHCLEKFDLMCDWPDGAATACPMLDLPATFADSFWPLDCGKDDYFSPAPAPGSYLATHWNTYRSVFLCEVPACAPDNVAPQITITAGPADGAITPAASGVFEFTTDDAGTITCSVDDAPSAPCASPAAYGPLADGPHTFTIAASDALGNVDTERRSFTVDTIAPNTILEGPKGTIHRPRATFKLLTTEGGVTYRCKLDKRPWKRCRNTVRLRGLSPGRHTFRARATDRAGHTDATPAKRRFRYVPKS